MTVLQAGERIGGRYTLELRLGAGGMGEVWLAELHGAGAFRRRVVLKVLAPERRGDDRLAAMLADEARIVGLLHHPGIIAALDYLETEEHGPIFVLEFVDGASLRTVLRLAEKRGALLPEPLAAHIGAAVAHALQAAHTASLQVIHRDVAPDNVLLSRAGAVYLGDFGVARAAGNSDVTQPGSAPKGKRAYMAPEQAAGRPVGPAADIYSLGKVIAESVKPGPRLAAVLAKACAERPEERFATASQFAGALMLAAPPPADPDAALAAWLHAHAPDALVARSTSHGVQRSTPPPAGIPPRAPELFLSVAPPRRTFKTLALLGALLFLALPIALIASAKSGVSLLSSAIAGVPAPNHGTLRISSRPAAAEVYVDGELRGATPLELELPVGHHELRIGSPRLERWRASLVTIKDGETQRLEFDLAE